MMTTNVLLQLTQLLHMVFFALCMMLAFDIVNALRVQAQWKRRQRTIVDFLFVLLGSTVFYIVLIRSSNGLLRNYTVMGLLLGIVIYSSLFRSRCKKICKWSAGLILWSGCKIKWVVFFPWRWLYRVIWHRIKAKVEHIYQKKMENQPQEEEMGKII